MGRSGNIEHPLARHQADRPDSLPREFDRDDPLAEVVPSGHGLDADAGDYLQD